MLFAYSKDHQLVKILNEPNNYINSKWWTCMNEVFFYKENSELGM